MPIQATLRRLCGRATARAVVVVAAAVVTLSLATGCATANRRAEYREFASGNYAAARAAYEAHIEENGAETTLDRNLAGTAALMQGDVAAAHRHFAEAFTDLDDLSATTGETLGALVGPDRSKRWKGDAHERSMNAYYLGVTYWLRGDVNNAAACFRAGLLRDADSAVGAAQSDFALLWYLLGMAQREARHNDGGEQALAMAQKLNGNLPAARAGEANVLVVMEAGMAPRKLPAGPHGAAVVYRPRDYRARAGVVSVDGVAVGGTVRAVDIYDQAVTRGGKTMDAVNAGKAVTKDVTTVAGAVILGTADNDNQRLLGAALLAAGLLLPAEADVRQWDTLPGEVHVLALSIPAGKHVVRVVPTELGGAPVFGTAREFDITVVPGHLAFLWMRAAPNGNVTGDPPFAAQDARGRASATMRASQ